MNPARADVDIFRNEWYITTLACCYYNNILKGADCHSILQHLNHFINLAKCLSYLKTNQNILNFSL